jgi:hypothetical protein
LPHPHKVFTTSPKALIPPAQRTAREVGGWLMLSVRYVIDDLDPEMPVQVAERRGDVVYRLARGLFVPEGVAALNSATAGVLAGGQWFQLWRGDIISMGSPEMDTDGGCGGGVHRGQVVSQRTRRP